VTISGLAASKDYDIYVVAEDSKYNLQTSPVKIDCNTNVPAFVSAETDTGGSEVLVTFNKIMADPGREYNHFTVLVNGVKNKVTDADLYSGDDRIIKLDLNDNVVYGQTVTVAYTAGNVLAKDGSVLATFGSKSVKNTVIKPPSAPSGLKASAGNGEVTLEWNAVTGAESYKVYQAVSSGGSYTQISSRRNSTKYNAGGLLNGVTYYFVVKACNDGGDSGNSNQVSITPISLPNVPTGLTASAGDSKVKLEWNAVTGATGYKVYRAGSSGGSYTQIWGGKEKSYTAAGLTNGKKYYFVVRAVNNSGDSEKSNEVSATPLGSPDPPTMLTASAGDGRVTLNWNAVDGAMDYKVYSAGLSGGPYTQISAGRWTSYTVTGLTNGKIYYYVVKASNSGGDSANSNQVSATPVAPGSAKAPTGLTAIAGNGLVTLNWNAVAGATNYKVYQSTGGTYALISAGETGTNYTVVGLTNGKTYYFVVKASCAGVDSEDSNEVSAIPMAPQPPKAPTGLTASAGNGRVTLNWNAVAGATGYKVYRAETAGGPYTQISAGETETNCMA
jgi:fibronectin type 3 domain-containing protein